MATGQLATATEAVLAAVEATPAADALRRRLAEGGALSCAGAHPAAQPFLAALVHRLFPERPLVVVTEGLKAQEACYQDLQTWLRGTEGRALGPSDSGPTQMVHAQGGALASVPGRLFFYPAWENLPHEERLPHVDVISERLETLAALANLAASEPAQAPVVVTSAVALMQRTFPADALRQRLRELRRGAQLEPLDLIEWLEDQGYEPEAQVTQKGELALRGGIVDVFPLTSPWPVRLEFFGNELESLRYFDPQTQISREETETVILPPAGELGFLRQAVERRLREGPDAEEATARNEATDAEEHADAAQPGPRPESASSRAAAGDSAAGSPGETGALQTTGADLATLLDYLPREAIFLLCEPDRLASQAGQYAQQIPAGDTFHVSWDRFQADLGQRGLTALAVRELADAPAALALGAPEDAGLPGWSSDSAGNEGRAANRGATCELALQGLDVFRPIGEKAPELQVAELQRREFFAQLHRWRRQGYSVHVFCNNEGERQRFAEVWQDYGLSKEPPRAQTEDRRPSDGPDAVPGAGAKPALDPNGAATCAWLLEEGLHLNLGTLARGFWCDAARLVVVTDAEVFGRYKVQRPRRLKSPHALAARSVLDINFSDLEPGDYVVHLQHGLGRYLGLERLEPSPTQKLDARAADALAGQECLVIEYAPTQKDRPPPKLYVPVTQAHLVSKYVGAGKGHPPLNTLGSARWAKTKAQAADAVRDLAADLLRVQAARASQPGFAFPSDTAWQREFEAAFLFEETPDQVQAIAETKRDLEAPKPMDRLICGDVGFGKTEVAIRAAFKAVLGGRQVAVLVPTTVLAQQHFNTFSDRMADYPVRLELLSRFRSRRQQSEVVRGLANGAVDIVIGTHRLIQADVQFKDLGLVIIDEEQRFGVAHKEKLKQWRELVDVLTLTATPIPRTLYLSLAGARDMSTIETPPQDRLPVETIISPYDERLVRDAIQRELNRGGQVFYLHNRVLDIESVALRLRGLVPHARLETGHGQMHADALEEVMTRFVNGQVDVLLSTTIIESGIDIPNANTIIIDRADRFGLSDLYQLRGRVGRYKHQAYAYLLLPRHAGLLEEARKRISALKQFSTPGSGFKIAMRDLELRGAGNLLGPEQSGHITAIGFELYCQLLKQSISALKGEPVRPRLEVEVRLDFLDLNPAAASWDAEHRRQPGGRRLEALGDETGSRTPDALAKPPAGSASRATRAGRAAACLPLSYVPEPQQRIEVYRKLAQATDKAAQAALRAELRDRFGPLPQAVELLLLVAELKRLAADRGVTALEVRQDKLMLTRQGDFIMVGGKFPRLTRKEARARLKEIRTVLLAL